MDPFSVVVGTLALIEVSGKLVKFVREISNAVEDANDDLHTLIAELTSLNGVTQSVEDVYKKAMVRAKSAGQSKKEDIPLAGQWEFCKQSLEACKEKAVELDKLFDHIHKNNRHEITARWTALKILIRKSNKDSELQRLRAGLAKDHDLLSTLLLTITVESQGASHDKLDKIFNKLKEFDTFFKSQEELQSRIEQDNHDLDMKQQYEWEDYLHRLRKLQEFVTTAFKTRHFYTPQPVSTFYTGRAQDLRKLQHVFFKEIPAQQQMRFVIHGMPGSGKTQFCCKFADDNRSRFWAVFWVDGRSIELIKQSYAEIGKYGGVEPNHAAAMHWLTTIEKPWLLIIDNADDKNLNLDEYFPKAKRGHILITTRVPGNKVYGNAGSFKFKGMDEEDASTLLLRSAAFDITVPPDADTKSWVTRIIEKLGSLALAVIHAGAAIRSSICTLRNYLTFFDDDLLRLRLQRTSANAAIATFDEGHMKAHATFEIMYKGIESQNTQSSRDAIELLKMFSFFHCENIRRDVLEKAIENCKLEMEQGQFKSPDEGKRPLTWAEKRNELWFAFLAFILADRSPPALPQLIIDGRGSGPRGVIALRLGYALGELINLSIVTLNEKHGIQRYSIHSLVHQWVRERPEMSILEQDFWSKAAATTLTHSILLPLPPHTNITDSALFRRELVPHILHVRARRQEIDKRMDNRGWWISKWLGFTSNFEQDQVRGPDHARQLVKFSLVFTETGDWEQARILQENVKAWTDRIRGLEHVAARRVTMFLSQTYWYLGRGDEAAKLQEDVLKACQAYLGPTSRETLTTMDTLGRSRWQQGRYTEAKELQKDAVKGLEDLNLEDDEPLLVAKVNLGRTLAKFYENLKDAETLYEDALEGMMNNPKLGRTHVHTLEAKEDLANLQMQMEGDKQLVLKSILEVLEDRKATLGKEHPFTLFTMASLARVYIWLGELSKAEETVCSGLEIADRNLGKKHIGTLMGRVILGVIYTKQGHFKAAEKTLKATMKGQAALSLKVGENHPDRIGTMIELAECYEKQEKFDEGIKICDQIIKGLRKISRSEHPLERQTQQRKDRMTKDRDAKKAQ